MRKERIKMAKSLTVLYQSDDNYIKISSISIASLLHNNQHLDSIDIFYCGYKVSQKNKNKLQSMVEKYSNATLEFMETEGYHQDFIRLGVKPWHGVYVTWLKMFAVNDIKTRDDRVLYLNSHTIINGSLDELIDLDFEDNVLALSYDGLINSHKKTIGLAENDHYHNCGVMLFNLRKWKKDNIHQEVKDHLKKKSDYVIADQDLCNVLFKRRIKTIGVSYNFSSAYYGYDLKLFLKCNNLKPEYFYSYDEIMTDYYSPKIIHSLYGIEGKPWEKGNRHPNRFLWKKYMKMTPWSNSKWPEVKDSLAWKMKRFLPKRIFGAAYMVAMKFMFGH